MTTDTDALKERIAQALYENAEYYGPYDVQPAWECLGDEERDEWRQCAAAVLPVVAVEVRKAQADAWDEGEEVGYVHGQHDAHRFDPGPDYTETTNPYRETGDSDEHR